MDAVLGETVALFHRLKDVSQQVYGQGELSSGQWGVLRDLSQAGSQTVPQMARSRPVSRQYIQAIVDALIAQGLVELGENPAHKRSSLIQLTTKGRSALEGMNRRAGMVFRLLSVRISEADLQRTASTLEAIRGLFVGEEWEHILTELKS
jgi:DNA-binding MarR family transcriptional regulator